MAEADIFDLVKADLDARDAAGRREYGRRLVIPYEGPPRDWLMELYEELLDAVVYIRALMEEHKHGLLR